MQQDFWQRFLIFAGVITLILAVAYGYVGLRITAGIREPVWKWAVWIVLGLALVVSPVSFLSRALDLPRPVEAAIAWTAYGLFGFLSMLLALILLRDLGILLLDGLAAVSLRVRSIFGESGVDDGRRQFLLHAGNMALVALTGAMTAYGLYRAKRFSIRRVRVPVNGLPPELAGLRIVQITDVHIGPTIRGDFAKRITQEVNALMPDIIAVTGDIVDGSVESLREHTEPFAELRAKLGVYFVTGNHEYYSGAGAWIREFERLGFEVLLNQHCILKRNGAAFMVAGVTDFRADEFFLSHTSSARAAASQNKYPAQNGQAELKILLAHQPRSIHEAAREGFHLQLSGHTHGGQYFPGPFLVKLQQPYVRGLHLHEKTWIYVSRGTGYWGPPIRVGAPPEITLIEIESA